MSRIPIDDDAQNEAPGETAGDASPSGAATSDVQKLQEDRDALFDRLARTAADYRNSQKRLQTEMDQRIQYANTSLIKNLLPVIDNFERALAVDPAKVDAATILKGMQIVHDQWLNVLKKEEVEEIAPEPGTPFDPTLHHALMQQPDERYTEPAVVQLLQKGYMLHGRTLRPANVIVSKTE